MRFSRRIMCVMLAASIVGTLVTGCARPKATAAKDPAVAARLENLNLKGFPIVKQPVTLNFLVSTNAFQKDYANTYVWKKYEEKTNVHINWTTVPSNNIKEKRNLILASGQNLPDAFYRCGFGSVDVQKYGSQGLFVKMNDLIDKYMPNLKTLLDKMDSVRKGLPTVDGSIYSLPGVSNCPEGEIGVKFFLNKKFMDKTGTSMPETLDDFYNVLKAMRDKDANGNGKADEVPLTSTTWSNIANPLKGAFGLMNKGSRHTNVDLDPKTNQLRFIPTTNEFRQLLEFLHKLYSEKLLDNEIFEMSNSGSGTTNVIAKSNADLVGAFAYTNLAIVSTKKTGDFIGIDKALKGPNGDQLWSYMRANTVSKGSFTMSKDCKYPEVVARWMDYWYSEEGARMFYLGVEGETYKKNADGSYEYLPQVCDTSDGESFDAVISKTTPYCGGSNPVIQLSAYFKGGEMDPVPKKAAYDMLKYVPKERWDYFTYTDEEADRQASLEADMFAGYYDIIIPQFISGEKPLNDQAWAEYCQKFKELGLDEYMKIYNSGYDRYKNAK
ncbi:MAG: extracellular solute-binding protein [Bacillota bacterium]|nr:extracellular solute-binding protein [Bacillota bacterium]